MGPASQGTAAAGTHGCPDDYLAAPDHYLADPDHASPTGLLRRSLLYHDPAGPSALPAGPDWATMGPQIFGSSLLSASQIAAWYASTGAVPHTTIPLAKVIKDYMKAGRVTGVRPDIAFAQSMDETAYFSFPGYGQDPPGYNNFAGIGACNKCKHGWSFPNAMAGALAQDTLLESYATPSQLSSADEGETQSPGVAGCCSTWVVYQWYLVDEPFVRLRNPGDIQRNAGLGPFERTPAASPGAAGEARDGRRLSATR